MALKQPDKARVSFDDLEFATNTAEDIYSYSGQLFTGYAVHGYYPNGQVLAEEEFRNGIVQGWVNEYYQSGQIKRESLVYLGPYSIAYYEYDVNGNQISGGLLVSQQEYNQLTSQYHLLD